MRLVLVIASWLLSAAAVAAELKYDEIGENIPENCSADWPDEYALQIVCINREEGARRRFYGELWHAYDAESQERNILGDCAAKWRGPVAGFRWSMVVICAERELDALRELKRLSN